MAICSRCGAQISDAAKFCPKCGCPAGTPVPPAVNDPTVAPAVPPAPASPAPAAARRKKQLPRWAVIVLVIAAAAAVWWFFIRKDPVKGLKEYVFYDYGTVPFGAVVDTVLPGAQWSSTGSGSSCVVSVSGVYRMTPFTMSFRVFYAGDTPVVQFICLTADGQQTTDIDSVVGDLYSLYQRSLPSYGW